jgi:charged multivesicular body protein 6
MGSYASKSNKSPPPEASQQTTTTTTKIVITDIDRAVLDLKNSRDRLQRYRVQLLLDDDKLLRKAQQAKQTQQQPTVALQLLRLRRHKQQQYEQCNTQLLNILQMVDTIDSHQNDQRIIQAMQVGKVALQQLQAEISIDDVLQLMEDIQDQHDMETDISNIFQQNIPQLSAAMGMTDEHVDQEIYAEFEAWQAEMNGEPQTPSLVLLPDVPTHALIPVPPTPTAVGTQSAVAMKQTSIPSSPEPRVAVLG